MGKSQETFNKKEKEKKKLKKKKDKEEKKEERKANSSKGQSFESMLAYVDENGNISSTPPDPKKMKTIKKEDIQIGISKHVAGDGEKNVRKGSITFFNESKGYGFIKDEINGESIFVHLNGLVDKVKEGDKVSFDVEKTPKGANAIDVRKIG
jgi:cold shock CspA family protein